MSRTVLHDYFRSSAAFRVRIALRLKGVEHHSAVVDLREGGQRQAEYRERNPQGFVPMLEIDGHVLTQSVAIIEYLDATRPEPRLMPGNPADQAHVRAMTLLIACDIHPLNNLRVLAYLRDEMDQGDATRDRWYAHWIAEGLTALEAIAASRAGTYLFGDAPSLADICLVPQLYNARRFNVALDALPLLLRVEEQCSRLPAFADASPDRVEPTA